MSARGVRAPLIFSALFGALVISCAGPPVYVVGPAPPLAAEHAGEAAPAPRQGGLAEVPEPAQAIPVPAPAAPPAQAPAPEAIPAPVPRAVPAPALPPRRPGGAPPGTELVDLPGSTDPVSVSAWMGLMAANCGDHGKTCLRVRKNYIKKKSCHDNVGMVQSQNPSLNKVSKVPVGSAVTLKISCTSNTDPGN